MRAACEAGGYNASSVHAEGRRTRALLDDARERIAAVLGVSGTEIIFTSGGTESDNLAVAGTMQACPRPSHVVASAIEHSAVLNALDALPEDIERTVLPVNGEGLVGIEDFQGSLRPHTRLASIMYANNEIGTIEPIAAAAAAARRAGVIFHTDAVAAASWLPLNAGALDVDLLSLSAHKLGGPPGVGLLYARRGVPVAPLLRGGGQESGRRAGTENVAAIAGMAVALELAAAEREAAGLRAAALRNRLERGVVAAVPQVRVNAGRAQRLPNVLSVSFAGVDSNGLLIALDLAGVAVSAGSACASGVPQPSHVLAALGLESSWQRGAIRFSLGHTTQEAEIDRVLELLPGVVGDLRGARPAVPGGWVD